MGGGNKDGGGSTQRLFCLNAQSPEISAEFAEEFTDSTMTVILKQLLGECTYKGEGLRTYRLPWYPTMYDVKIIDSDFDAIIFEERVLGTLADSIELVFQPAEQEIPWCVNVTTYLMDAYGNPIKLELMKCMI